MAWREARTAGQQERLAAWLEAGGDGLVIVELGAGSAVPTVRAFSERVARLTGALLVRINPREPEAPPGALSLPLGALAALERITPH